MTVWPKSLSETLSEYHKILSSSIYLGGKDSRAPIESVSCVETLPEASYVYIMVDVLGIAYPAWSEPVWPEN